MTRQSSNFERTSNCNADSQCDSVYVSALSDRQTRVASERQVPGQNQGDLVGRQIIPNVEIESGDKSTSQKTDWASARVEARRQSEANIMNGNPVHHVRFGDCLWDIASASFHKNNGHKPNAGEIMGEVNRLAKKNNIADANNIAIGTAIDTSTDKAVRPSDLKVRPQTSWQSNDQSGRAPNYYDFNGGRRNDAHQQGPNYYDFNARSNQGFNSNYYEFNGNPNGGLRTDYRLGDYFDRWQHPNNQNNPLVRLPNISDRQPSSNLPEVRPDANSFGPRNIDPGMEVRPQAKNTTTWRNAHNELVAKARRGAPNVAFYGDSITQGLQLNSGFKTSFGRTENFGIGGDTNQNLLYRLQNGEADFPGGKPETAVLLIGTNNIGSQTPDKIAAGILANARELTNRLPGTEVVVMGILPRGYSATDPLRRQVNAVNDIVRQKLQGVPGVKFVDISPQLLNANGNMRAGVFQKDNVHLTYNTGYSTMLQALRPHIRSGG